MARSRGVTHRDGIAAAKVLAGPKADRSICNLCDRKVTEPANGCVGRRHPRTTTDGEATR